MYASYALLTHRRIEMVSLENISNCIKQIFEDEVTRSDHIPGFTSEIAKEALTCDCEEELRQDIFGYPSRPIYRDIANQLYTWITTKECPALKLPHYPLLDEQSYVETRSSNIATIRPMLEGLSSLWDLWNDDEKKYRIREILLILELRGMLDFLGLRKTVGTLEVLPPPRTTLEKAFTDKHSERADLSVGARALAKHGHRDETATWWGVSKGSEVSKNKHAFEIVSRILDGAAWINIHQIVHEQKLLEVRQTEGYGARWSHDGTMFRGFLEPQMEGGHELGWKH